MVNVIERLKELRDQVSNERDSELEGLAYVLPQYVTDHRDRTAYRQIDRQCNALARAIDRTIAVLDRAIADVEKAEGKINSEFSMSMFV